MNKSIKRTIAAVSMTAMLAAGFALPVSAATQVEVTGNPVMIRADAGLKNTVVSKAHKGDKYVYVGQKKDSTGRVWYNIKYSGNKTGWITSQFAKKTETSAANPVKAYEGTYQCDRATITVKASGKSDAKITVKWGSSAWENSVWEMSGMFDSSVYRVDYGNGVRTDYVYNDNGSVSSKKVAYKNSTGRVQFKDTKTLVWRDENEQDNGEMTFTKISDTATQPEQPVATAKQVQITGNPVNVRAGAGTNYKKLGKTSKGKTYTYLASKKDSSGRVWYQIQYTSKTKGWVMGSLAKLVGQTAAVKEDAFMKAIFKDVTSSDQYKEWKKMNPEATITEKLSGSTITFTVTGGLNIDGMDDEDFTNDKPVIAGKYVFKHNGDYVVYTSQDAKHLSNPFNAFILIAICDYYGMSFVTANEYIAAHPDNTYYIVDKKANTIKMYAAAKWNMK
ncbi:MAG: SH3 domain-containing protein [Clostridia bacterium]|nr:SH3 domain-containing protein [Clostridia bacterium]